VAAPRIIKRLLKSSPVLWGASALGAGYLLFAALTTRRDRPSPPPGGPFILAMWHSRILMLDHLRPSGRALVALISEHSDGKLISRIARLGSRGKIRTVKGSSSRGSAKALRELLRYARAGHTLFITPDGPRGPNMRAQRGVVELARLTGLPILPASVSIKWRSECNSWDRMMFPYPFTRAAVRWGEPIHVNRDAHDDLVLAQVEAALNACQRAADEACGGRPEAVDVTLSPALQPVRNRRREPRIS
jgi:lysophospholipid acyltransferase (LPLAT)-like uncharacterized protein